MHKHLISMMLLIITIMPFTVLADSFVTDSGFVIPEEDYENFSLIFSKARLHSMTEDDYNEIIALDLDFDNMVQDRLFVRSDYNAITGETVETILTENEFYNQLNAQKNLPNQKATVITTGYKQEVLTFVHTNEEYAYFNLYLEWLNMPAIRSFDVIGARFQNCEVVNGSQEGLQLYKLRGSSTYTPIEYSWNGTNINNFYNGFGISMNLVNSDVVELSNEITALIRVNALPSSVYASYQHATRDITLAISKSYTLGNGLGNVFAFSNNYASYFDDMQGTFAYFNS